MTGSLGPVSSLEKEAGFLFLYLSGLIMLVFLVILYTSTQGNLRVSAFGPAIKNRLIYLYSLKTLQEPCYLERVPFIPLKENFSPNGTPLMFLSLYYQPLPICLIPLHSLVTGPGSKFCLLYTPAHNHVLCPRLGHFQLSLGLLHCLLMGLPNSTPTAL